MEPFPNVSGLTIFPKYESRTFEFKETYKGCDNNKIYETLCGFLNSGGGYMVFGVKDDRTIVGITNKKDSVDSILKHVDNIYHTKHIVKKNRSPIHPSTIQSRVVDVSEKIKILVIEAIPESGEEYTLNDGSIFFRLNASNYRLTQNTVKHDREIINITIRERDTYKRCYDNLAQQLREQSAKIKPVITQLHTIETKYAEIMTDLEKQILELKTRTEDKLSEEKRTWWSYLTCGIPSSA